MVGIGRERELAAHLTKIREVPTTLNSKATCFRCHSNRYREVGYTLGGRQHTVRLLDDHNNRRAEAIAKE